SSRIRCNIKAFKNNNVYETFLFLSCSFVLLGTITKIGLLLAAKSSVAMSGNDEVPHRLIQVQKVK
ncbi:MAG: hypothetical protein M3530_12450, partial [Thermoproteota archaeon]|nr:hypothetical protein [Thermoproteota archaeon]